MFEDTVGMVGGFSLIDRRRDRQPKWEEGGPGLRDPPSPELWARPPKSSADSRDTPRPKRGGEEDLAAPTRPEGSPEAPGGFPGGPRRRADSARLAGDPLTLAPSQREDSQMRKLLAGALLISSVLLAPAAAPAAAA